jgi:hypothetical protein
MLVGRVKAYQTDPLTKNATSRKDKQDINSPLEPCHELAIVSSKVTESLCLPLKNVNNGVGGFAIDKLVDYLMLVPARFLNSSKATSKSALSSEG